MLFPSIYTLMAEAMMVAVPRKYRVEKEKTKCRLPDCGTETDHNGGYCCAEHCKLHRELIKKN